MKGRRFWFSLAGLLLMMASCLCAQRRAQRYPELELDRRRLVPRFIVKTYPQNLLSGAVTATGEVSLPGYFSLSGGVGLLLPTPVKDFPSYERGLWDEAENANAGFEIRIEPRHYFLFDQRCEGAYLGLLHRQLHYSTPPGFLAYPAFRFMDFGFSGGVQLLLKDRICLDFCYGLVARLMWIREQQGWNQTNNNGFHVVRLGLGWNFGPSD